LSRILKQTAAAAAAVARERERNKTEERTPTAERVASHRDQHYRSMSPGNKGNTGSVDSGATIKM
jgi:hypothetical protein